MKQNFHSCGLLFFILFLITVITSQASARFLATKQGVDEPVKFNNLNMEEGSESLGKLMGLEECKNGDEECLKRRVIADIHLDYIYSQHNKP